MSIEAMKLALEAVQDLRGYRPDIDSAIETLRNAIQQAEEQQPDTGEPVACATPDGLKSNWHAHHAIVNKAALQMVRNALRNDVERGLKVRGEMLAELDSATFQAHPAPSVPDDVVRAKERYQYLLHHMGLVEAHARTWNPAKHKPLIQFMQDFIDAAMLAAKEPT